MRFDVLGPMRLERDGEPVPLTSGRQRALLAMLLLADSTTVSSDALIDGVWGDDLPSDPANTLQHGIAQLRKALEPGRSRSEPSRWLISEASGYRLDRTEHGFDAAEFEIGVGAATDLLSAGDAQGAARDLRTGLGLWRGSAYGEFAYAEFAVAEADRLEELRIRARELLTDAEALSNGPETVIADLEALAAEYPYREGIWARLMRALYQSGRQAEALRAFKRASDILGEELGIEPSEELRELEEQILLQDSELAPTRVETPRHNLPSPTNRLIGRQEALDQVVELAHTTRLVTLIGPGGTGKTRLAIEVGHELLDSYPDGVWIVRLDDLADDELLISKVGAAIAMPEDAEKDAITTLADFIGEHRLLLILDNCEHLIGCVADLAEVVLASCPNTTILATSQEALRLTGEHRFPVPPLRLPGHGSSPFDAITSSPAVELFMERAVATNPEWDDSAESTAAVANIVDALDGVPLAIELAAARTDLLTASEIARRLAERFDLLQGGPRDAPVRQRTLRNTVEWSYGLLDETDQDFFARLGGFAGSFDVAAAAAVTGTSESDSLIHVDNLLQRSLLGRDSGSASGSRFRLLETLRIFCIEKLHEHGIFDEVADRHLDHFAAEVLRLDDQLVSADQRLAFAEMVASQDNFRSAMARSLESGRLAPGVTIAAWSGRFWDWHGSLSEAAMWTDRFLQAAPAESTPNFALLMSWAGFYAREFGDETTARELAARAMGIAEDNDDLVGQTVCLTGLAMDARISGDNEGALAAGAQIRELAPQAGMPWMIAWADNHDGLALLAAGDLDAAEEISQESLRRFAELGDERATGWALTALAQIARARGDLGDSIRFAQQAVAVSHDAGDGRNAAWALELAADAAGASGDSTTAEQYAEEAEILLRERGMPASPWRRTD